MEMKLEICEKFSKLLRQMVRHPGQCLILHHVPAHSSYPVHLSSSHLTTRPGFHLFSLKPITFHAKLLYSFLIKITALNFYCLLFSLL